MSSLAAAAVPSSLVPMTSNSADTFRSSYNRTPFQFEHSLHQHPLMELSQLLTLARQVSRVPDRLYYNVGAQDVGQGWDLTSERPFPADEAIDRIANAGAFLMLKSVQREPAYGALLRQALEEIHAASAQPLDGVTHTHQMSVIMTSPARVTAYHIDNDCNYLLQLRGSKTLYVFDGNDPTVVTNEELERFYAGDVNAATYKESSQGKAYRFELTPGTGVHIPVTFPHWVQNHDNVSVSVSLNFCFSDTTVPDLHKFNRRLRKMGLRPKRPGQSKVADATKHLAVRVARAATRSGRP